jgi:exonuclease VII large subunit
MAAMAVDQRAARLGPCATSAVDHQAERVDAWRRLLAAYDVDRQLERGYTLTLGQDGRIVRSVGSLTTGSVLVTRFADGAAVSDVRKVDVTTGGTADVAPAAGREEHR